MKRSLIILCLIVVAFVSGIDMSAQLVWREVNARQTENNMKVESPEVENVEIFASQGAIMVRTNHKIQVRVFTILGQLVSQATLNPGTSELKMNSRGIYIVKIGNITQKVAI